MLDELERLGLAENTIVVLWGDHSWNLAEHTMWCKHSCFETSMHAPLIVRAPDVTQADQRTNALTEFIDIYQDDQFYSAFPSIVKLPTGELLCAFRRAPERRAYGEKGSSHTDPNSYLVLVRSTNNGLTWSKQPELIFAHPYRTR